MDAFYYASKIIWPIIQPGNFIFILVFISLVLIWLQKINPAKITLTFTATIMLFITFFPVGGVFLYPLEKNFNPNKELPEEVDGIIVLAGSLNLTQSHLLNQVQVGEAFDREIAFIKLAKHYPNAKLFYAGTPANHLDPTLKGYDAQDEIFLDLGFDLSRITFNKTARNTFENVKTWIETMAPQKGDNWILITSASHMYRSIGIFCKAGQSVIPYPVDFRTDLEFDIEFHFSKKLQDIEIGVKEWIGLLAYWVTGKTSEFMTKSCN